VTVESSEQFAFFKKMNIKMIRREKENDVCSWLMFNCFEGGIIVVQHTGIFSFASCDWLRAIFLGLQSAEPSGRFDLN
jgi:hypothetical protein